MDGIYLFTYISMKCVMSDIDLSIVQDVQDPHRLKRASRADKRELVPGKNPRARTHGEVWGLACRFVKVVVTYFYIF